MRIPIALLAILLFCSASPVRVGCFGRSGLFIQDAGTIYQRQFVVVPQSRFFMRRGTYVPAFQQFVFRPFPLRVLRRRFFMRPVRRRLLSIERTTGNLLNFLLIRDLIRR